LFAGPEIRIALPAVKAVVLDGPVRPRFGRTNVVVGTTLAGAKTKKAKQAQADAKAHGNS
jgi:hypothetical protein